MFGDLDYQALGAVVLDQALVWGARLIGALLLLVIAWWLSRIVARSVTRTIGRTKLDVAVTNFLASTTRLSVLGLGILLCLSLFGVQMTTIAALVGGAGVAVGLALKGNLANVATGLVILAVRPFKVGDHVKVASVEGIVEAIQLITTHLRTFDGADVFIPNELVFSEPMINYDGRPQRRVDVLVGVSYSADLDHVIEVLTRVAESVPERIESEDVLVRATGFGASSVDFKIGVWVPNSERFIVYHNLLVAVKKALDSEGIGIPFPQRDVHIVSEVRSSQDD